MRARERSRVGKGAPPAFRRGRSVTRFSQLYALLLCTFALLPLAGKAQELPPRAIRIIVPSPPGAAGDISARLIGAKLSESLRQPVGVVIALAQTIDRIQNKKASFDIVKDFTPITAIANNPAGLVVNSRLAAASLTAFVDLVRKRPREISYASGGIGTAHHLYGQILNRTAGIEMLYVPYKGVAPAVNDVLGGHVPAAIVSLATALPHIQSGQLRLLTVFDTKRYAKLPDVPTIAEEMPGFVPGRTWIGLLGPPDLPAATTARLHDEVVRILNSAEVQRVLGDNGLETIANTPSEFAVMIEEDARIWDAAPASAGLLGQ